MGFKDLLWKSADSGSTEPLSEMDQIMKEAGIEPTTPASQPTPTQPAVATGTYGPPPKAVKPSIRNADFPTIFDNAGVPRDAQVDVEKAVRLAASLAGLPEDARRSAVEAALATFGIDKTKLVGVCQTQQRALDAWERVGHSETRDRIKAEDEKIAALTKEIEAAQARQKQAADELAALRERCNTHKAQLQNLILLITPKAS